MLPWVRRSPPGVLLWLAVALLPACARDEPSAPRFFTVSGNVRMTGYLTAEDGHFTGTRVLGDADGVAVELLYGDQVVARTTTADGVYRFTGVTPGGYRVRAPVMEGFVAQTRPITVATFDQHVGDTLRLESQGDLYPSPNPMITSSRIYFDVTDPKVTDLRILDLAGNLVRTLPSIELPEGRRVAVWNGLDADGQPATAAMYWATYSAPGDVRAQLIFR